MDHSRTQEWEKLRATIAQWNDNRLDLFELSEPDQKLNFHGVMRFYYQDSGQKVSTKCIRVSSDATSQDVIATLIEKFRPDMRMLSTPRFALYEIHESGAEERELAPDERPLHVQLNWHQDDREGRFLLRNLNEKRWSLRAPGESTLDEGNFKRKLSKREKKDLKKKGKLHKIKSINDHDSSVAEKLYTELPETSFTRSISNPEAVMRRRRQQKLEKKLQQFRSRDGGPDTGGTLKIYGESLCSDVPYKTLLLSVTDTAAAVVQEMLQKYGRYREDPNNYCLVQVVTQEPQQETREYRAPTGPYNEYILEDDECPLAILINHPPTPGSIMFHVRRRPNDYQPRKRKKLPNQPSTPSEVDHSYRGTDEASLPFLLELNADGSDVRHQAPRRYSLRLNVTEVGSERSPQAGGQCLQLAGHNVHPRHCVIAHTEGIVTVTPCGREAETYVNGQRVYETTILQHGCVVQFGRVYRFRFLDPAHEAHQRPRGRRESGRGHNESYAERSNNYASFRRGSDPILPAVLEFREETEDAFLRAVITRLDPSSLQFKLAPTYTLYMAARFRASTHYRSDLSPNERALRLTNVLAKVASMIRDVVQMRRGDANSLAFWMANASEYLHFLKQDRHVSAYSRDAQDILAESVQSAFWNLVDNVQSELGGSIGHFLEDRDDSDEEEGTTAEVLSTLGNTMALLRRCRVNAALTIQLFSQLFHYINMGVFNMLVMPGPVNYCSRMWGERLKRRLSRTELWADRQGLELAADCHLGRVVQAAHLLTAPKNNVDDLTGITSTCYKLNSLQLRAMLERYQPAADEPAKIPPQLIDNIVRIAESTSDELARQDGRPVRLEESRDLQLPFLLPEDGYSSDIVRGIPNGLTEFIAPLQHAGLARMSEQPTSWGYWTIYMTGQEHRPPQMRSPSAMSNRSMGARGPPGGGGGGPPPAEPEVQLIKLQKSNTGMGLSIVAAKGLGQEQAGIYVKSVVRGGAADLDGRLAAGDQLLEVDGHSLIGITQEQAAEYMMKTGPVVLLRVAKQAAVYHRLTALLSQPSPTMSRGSRRASERGGMPPTGRIQSAKSVPALSSDGGDRGGPMAGVSRGHQETYNPGFSLSASNASLAALPGPGAPTAAHARSRSVQNLHKPGGPAGGGPGPAPGPAPPPRPISVHAHYQQGQPGQMPGQMLGQMPGGPRSEMPRSVSEHEHLRYRHSSATYSNTGPGAFEPPRPAGPDRPYSEQLSPGLGPEPGGRGGPGPADRPPAHGGAPGNGLMYGERPPHGSAEGMTGYGYERPVSAHGPPDGGMAPYGDRHERPLPPHGASNGISQHGDRPLPPPHSSANSGVLSYGDRPPPPHSSANNSVLSQYGDRPLPPHSSGGALPYGDRPPPPHSSAGGMPGYGERPLPPHSAAPASPAAPPDRPPLPPHSAAGGAPLSSPYGERRPSGPEPMAQRRRSRTESFSDLPPPPPPASAAPAVRFEEPPPARPPPPQELYGEPLPPPPPPAQTHPLYGQPPQRPPPPAQQAGYDAGNPWTREEREKQEENRKKEVARKYRDQLIEYLEGLPNRSRREQEQLQALVLEKRFQERCDLGGDDDDEDEDDDDDNQEMNNSRADSDVPPPPPSEQPPALPSSEQPERPPAPGAGSRTDEVRRRQAELEAAQQAEQGILREAQRRRQIEEDRQRRQMDEDRQRVAAATAAVARARAQPAAPPPPGRTVSFGAVTTAGELRPPAVPPKPEVAVASVVSTRRVQLNEPAGTPPPPLQPAGGGRHHDPDRFIDEARQMMAATSISPPEGPTSSSVDASATPGVIGAQEVYRDPRTRRLALMQDRQPEHSPVPEKLSFKEKMKMFAAETG
ncbi:afadin-like isoform X3 [Amphibalanus amphitrite]|uniref:afadin-like isoform X3 n=1 Tax=Amphibalanus amphitrite TaxID=1232801 RepID=UPI001C926AA0|nr:afadin-like isoform X3 [Amphibalanus amphitrite]